MYDLIVIGGGVIGLSTAYHASKDGKTVLVLEKDVIGSQNGSSSGKSRQFRLMHAAETQGRLAIKTVAEWKQLEDDTKKAGLNGTLVYPVDELWFGNNDPDIEAPEGNFLKMQETCEKLRIDLQQLNADALRDVHNFKNVSDEYIGLNGVAHTERPGYVAGAGNVNMPFVVKALHTIALAAKVEFKEKEAIEQIEHNEHSVKVKGSSGTQYEAKKLVIAAGSWTNHMLKHFNLELNLEIWQMISCYFKVEDANLKHPMWISMSFPEPDSIWGDDPKGRTGLGFYYGFPESDWEMPGYIRVCPTVSLDKYGDADQATHKPNEKEVAATENWVKEHIKGVSHKAEHLSTCLTTVSPDGDFVCGLLPGTKNVAVFTAGWGAKFIPMFGKLLHALVFDAELDDELREILNTFRVDRPDLKHEESRRHGRANADSCPLTHKAANQRHPVALHHLQNW